MHFADLFEVLADTFSDNACLVCGSSRRTWREFDDRAARLAQALQSAGLSAGAKVAFYLYNGNEYIEAYFATLKIRGVAVNVNYRYVEQELKYLLEYSDAEAIFFHSSLGERVVNVTRDMPQIKLLVEIENDTQHVPQAKRYEDIITSHAPALRIPRFDTDLFMNFTGGTTGMPKGVVYQMGDLTGHYLSNLAAYFGGNKQVKTAEDLVDFAKLMTSFNPPPASLPACPLMHTAGLLNGLLSQLLCGAKIVTLQSQSFDAVEMLETIERERITFTVIVGDAFCLPILEALDKAKSAGRTYDLSSLKMVMSSGVAWSRESKRRLLEYADAQLMDAMGATEGGMGMSVSNRKQLPGENGIKFNMFPDTKVFDENDQEIQPGSGKVGHIAAGGGFVPIAYYKDPEKSAKTFRVINGKRYSFIGDMGTVEADGTLTVMGRGSGCINTAGEKVFPEEVEAVLRLHPDVDDCLVLAAPHDRFGHCVAAIIATNARNDGIAESITQHCKLKLAGYKVPRVLNFQAKIERGPNGKADYKWAKGLIDTNM